MRKPNQLAVSSEWLTTATRTGRTAPLKPGSGSSLGSSRPSSSSSASSASAVDAAPGCLVLVLAPVSVAAANKETCRLLM